MELSKYKMHAEIKQKAMQYAKSVLKKYKWNEQQEKYLKIQAEKGRVIAPYNEVAAAFKRPLAADGRKKCLLVIGYLGLEKGKKNISINSI